MEVGTQSVPTEEKWKKWGLQFGRKNMQESVVVLHTSLFVLAKIVSIWLLQKESNIIDKRGIILEYFKPLN